MSTANKLSYLNDTKSLLRTSLNKFGSSILSTDTFRSYDTKLNDIYDKLPKVTQSGTEFTIENVQNGQVDDFKMIGTDLYQNTTKGINLFNFGIRSRSQNGITTNYNLSEAIINGTITNANSIIGFATRTSEYSVKIGTYPAGSYVFKFEKVSGNLAYSSGASEMLIRNSSDITIFKNTIKLETTNFTKSFTLEQETELFIQWFVNEANWIFTDYTCRFMITSGIETDYDFEPYTGKIAAPNPDYPQEIKVVEGRQVINIKGKNLFDKDNAQILNGYIKDDNGIDSQRENWSYLQSYVSVLPNTTYTISGKLVQISNNIRTYYYDNDKNWISRSEGAGSGINIVTFTTPNNCYYIQFQMNTNYYDINSIQIEEDSTATDYEPYYNPVSYNIDLNLENIYLAKMPNTDYKNRIYKNNGNWYYEKNIKKVILDGSEDESWGTFKNSMILLDLWNNNPTIMCDYFKPTTNSIWVSDDDSYRGMCSSLNTSGQFRCMPLTNMTLAEFKTWLSTHNVIVWYELQNPVTTQITNTTLINQLEAISVHTGTNIITISNSNNIIPEIEITRLKELEKLA